MGRDGQCGSERHAYGRPWQRTVRRAAVVVLLLTCSAAAAPAPAPDPKAEAKAKKAAPAPAPPDLTPEIEQIADAQRALAASLAQLRDQLAETQRAISELRDETRGKHEASQQVVDQVLDQVEGMRKEVWGLYVESSGLKGDIAQTDKQMEGLDQDLGNFRLSAGIVVAVVIVLQFVLVGLAFRGRG